MFSIEVDWRDGTRTTLDNATAGRLYEIRQAATRPIPAKPSAPTTLFTDASVQLGHRHTATYRDDFELQSALPRSLNHDGPALATADVDGDGDTDLLVTDTNDPQLTILLNDGTGNFKRSANSLPTGGIGLVPFTDGPSQMLLHLSVPPVVYKIESGQLRLAKRLAFDSTPGSAAAFDAEGDGDTDLFIGGGTALGQFPVAAESVLFINNGSDFTPKPFSGLGLVRSVEAGDMDGDGDTDLVLAREWNSIALLQNNAGKFTEAGQALGLGAFKGLWHDAKLTDVNGDGTLDIVASNIGLNTPYTFYGSPVRLLYGDADADGINELAEIFVDRAQNSWRPVRNLEVFASTFPQVRGTYTRNRAFATATVPRILGPTISDMKSVEMNSLATGIFLNVNGKFTFKPLPDPAQLSPAFAICVADFDGDGAVDLFLSQNDFGVPPRYSRYDSGRGLLLTGDGKGGFQPKKGQQSGITIYGEQRGAVVADFNGDKKPDLAVTQRDAETKLYLKR
ncbi:MAG: hypothetical protein CMO63_02530 [Verrucomicrobiales bacterium]|nr:hypothetical protein [Verrucomicrobiales bacterium]